MNHLPEPMLRALGWALTHAVWQAALFALALLLLLPRLKTAKQRYWAAYGTLVSVLAAAVGTFFWKYELPETASSSILTFSGTDATASTFYVESQWLETNVVESFSHWLETNHALVVAVWLIGFAFFLLRLGGGVWHVHRLRSRKVEALANHWQERLQILCGRIGVARSVRLLESALAVAPLTIGWLKPVILLPVGFANQLTPAEVEAVLAHELAHIARRDWFFNLIQAFIETIFYYHPAVWWISAVIRRERENACDDLALAATGNPLAFARALVQVQELAKPAPALALAMSGNRRRTLLERVRRILNQAPQQQHQVMEKITATVVLLALLTLVGLRANSVPSIEAAFAQLTELPSAIFGGPAEDNQMQGDTIPKPKSSRKITQEDESGRIEAEYQDGKLSRLNINGEEIPEAEFEEHEDLIEQFEEAVAPPTPPSPWRFLYTPDPASAPRAFWFDGHGAAGVAPIAPVPPMPPMDGMSVVTEKDDDGNTIIKLDINGKSTEMLVKDNEVWVDGKKLENGESVDIPGLLYLGQHGNNFFFDHNGFGNGAAVWGDGNMAIARGHRLAEREREQMDREMERAHRELERAHREHDRAMEQHQRDFEREQKLAEKEWARQQKNWEKEQLRWEKEQQKWEKEQARWEAKNKAAQELLKAELLRDGLISDPENFSFTINAKEMKVNKKKQSEELRKKYAELLAGATGMKLKDDFNFSFNFSND